MSDYYKTNTLGLPQFQIDETYKRNFFSCSLLNYQNLCVNIFNRFFIRTFFKDNKTLGRNYFSKNWFVLLTSQSQIEYLSNCSIQNLNETRLTNNDLRNKNEERSSSSLYGNKIKFVRSVL